MEQKKLYCYTGIGSRKTPEHVLGVMRNFAISMAEKGYILRSGGAAGADTAFELGQDYYWDEPESDFWKSINKEVFKEIYLPWEWFNGSQSPRYLQSDSEITKSCLQLAETVHPKWKYLNQASKLLHARNCQQILGENLTSPSDFVICWTPKGSPSGGTATAIKLAEKYGIPVWNLGNEKLLNHLLSIQPALNQKQKKQVLPFLKEELAFCLGELRFLFSD